LAVRWWRRPSWLDPSVSPRASTFPPRLTAAQREDFVRKNLRDRSVAGFRSPALIDRDNSCSPRCGRWLSRPLVPYMPQHVFATACDRRATSGECEADRRRRPHHSIARHPSSNVTRDRLMCARRSMSGLRLRIPQGDAA